VELALKYRPVDYAEVVGQRAAVSILKDMTDHGRMAHCVLFTGPSGTGKTTLARIARNKIGCSDIDFVEINASDDRGIGMVRNILEKVGLAPLSGACRVYLIDECQALTEPAQNSLLKVLEEPPEHVYFFLATTDPQKLKRTIITRSTVVPCETVSENDLLRLSRRVADAEGVQLPVSVASKIADMSDGSPRKALVLLNSVLWLGDEESQLEAVSAEDTAAVTGFELAKVVCRKGAKWSEVAGLLDGIHKSKVDPDAIRLVIMGYARTMLLRSGDLHPASVIDNFKANFWESKHAGLALACYKTVHKL